MRLCWGAAGKLPADLARSAATSPSCVPDIADQLGQGRFERDLLGGGRARFVTTIWQVISLPTNWNPGTAISTAAPGFRTAIFSARCFGRALGCGVDLDDQVAFVTGVNSTSTVRSPPAGRMPIAWTAAFVCPVPLGSRAISLRARRRYRCSLP